MHRKIIILLAAAIVLCGCSPKDHEEPSVQYNTTPGVSTEEDSDRGSSQSVLTQIPNIDESEEVKSDKEIWSKASSLLLGRAGISAATVNGKIYAIGGETTQAEGLNNVEEYDPKTDVWIKKADMPTKRELAITVVFNEEIYVIGGLSNNQALSNVEVYNPIEDKWTEKSDMPIACGMLASGTVVNDKIYVIGANCVLQEYSPSTDTWVTKSIPEDADVEYRTLIAVDGKVYAIGGFKNASVKNIDVYDPVTDTWTQKADMPDEKYEVGLVSINSNIFIIGGFNETNKLLKDVDKYDTLTEIWTKMTPMPEGAHMPGIALLDDKVYIIGGHNRLSRFEDLRNTVLVYDTSIDN